MKNLPKYLFVVSGITASFLALPLFAGAQIPSGLPTTITQVANYTSGTLVNFLLLLFWAVTAIFILWAAFLYLFGASDEDRTTRAKQMLMYAIVAGIIALFSTVGLRKIVESLFS